MRSARAAKRVRGQDIAVSGGRRPCLLQGSGPAQELDYLREAFCFRQLMMNGYCVSTGWLACWSSRRTSPATPINSSRFSCCRGDSRTNRLIKAICRRSLMWTPNDGLRPFPLNSSAGSLNVISAIFRRFSRPGLLRWLSHCPTSPCVTPTAVANSR